MPNKIDGDQNVQSAKVLKLGFNISVSGDPGTDFEIVLDDKEQGVLQSSAPQEEQLQHFDALELESYSTQAPKHETEKKNTQGFKCVQSKDAIQEQNKTVKVTHFSKPTRISGSESMEDSAPQDSNIISKIMSTMEHFEKFSDHIKDIPRLRNCPLATSTPLSDKYNSRPDSSLMYSESRPRKYSHLYDFHSRKEYFKSSHKPMPPNLFLKPLPGEGYYTRGVYTRYFDLEPYRHYGSDSSLNKASESKTVYGKSSYDVDKQDGFPSEPSSGILKKSDSESGDKQSTSSADSVKDIKIYQSGGILIMQNFKDNMDASEKKEISEFSAKLIENCNKLKMEVSGFQENKLAIGNFSEETKNSGKMVQFDLSNFEKSKSDDFSSVAVKDESSVRMESSESTSDCMKNKDSSPQGTSQSQDFTSLSTQENDSIMSNPPGMSPNYASSKKLEWDSGADIGYLNLDLSKENLSTIEKIVLKGLSSDGMSEEKVVYEKKSKQNPKTRTKLTLERMHSDSAVEKSDERGTADCSKKETEVTSEEIKSRNVSEERTEKKISPAGNTKGVLRFESEETKRPTTKSSGEETYEVKKKPVELTDSSVNVNTLFENVTWRTPPDQTIPKEFVRPSESPTKVTYRRPSHSSRAKVSKHKNRPSPTRLLKAPKKSTVGGSLVASYIDMGNPKKVYKKVEASPVLNDVELSREVEEIIIDQRFKIKQNVVPGREAPKEPNALAKDKSENLKDGEVKSRPISASSSSNNTVLPKSDAKEKMEEKTKTSTGCKFIDQMIQTSDCDCTSVSVQAFASQMSKVSSDRDFRGLEKKERKLEDKVGRENVNVSSKNIQAFGLNSSLPKQLEHPKEMELVENQHTKSTQYFGGPLNSLPNYHSKVVGKPGESCARAMNVLKQKRNSEAEIIRMKEENEKNILANDTSAEHKKESSRRFSNKENKENLITEKSSGSKRTQANGTRKNSGEFDREKKESEGGGAGKGKKKSGSTAGSDGSPTSDDVSSLVLTSEVLKEHGDSIDRNIIQEKYFQSQLMELEKRKMISRSTSMEIQLQIEGGDTTAKEFMSTGCQYSPQSRGTSGGPSQEPEDESFKGNPNKKTRKRTLLGNRNPDGNAETGDSLPSSTQTAHSWVAGMRSSRENSAGVGKARSFEYLPGHIYESSGNLREELPSETERNLISNSSSDSDRTARGSGSNDGAGDSEGRHTLVLENSTEYSNESEQLKILDENLTQLNLAVTKLSEKDAQVENLTKSLLANFCRKTGSGDWLLLGEADSSKIEVGEKRDFTDNGVVPREAVAEGSGQTPKEDAKEKEISIGCQTEEKSPSSDPGKFQVERKAFEKRISEEKKCQIKWIENEIYHLNVLRRLLESPGEVKKKRSFLSVTSNGSSKSEENDEKNISQDHLEHRPVTPTYGCTIGKVKNTLQESSRLTSEQSSPHPEETEPRQRPQYGVAVSLTGCPKNWQRVVMLPVGVQVSLKDAQSMANCGGKEVEEEKTSEFFRENSLKSARRRSAFQSDVETQYPSAKRESSNCPSTSVQADLPSGRSGRCTKENCFCINLSDKSFSSSSRSKTSERKRSWGLDFIPEERGMEKDKQRGSATGLGFQDLENYPEHEKMRSGNREESSDIYGNYSNSRTAQSGNCKCQNCPGRVSTPVNNSEVTPQPNIHLNRKKSSEFGTCSCTKIKICACKVNKIQGSKCCCTESIFCLCKRQRPTKKTGSQGCQTECESVIMKDLVEYPEIKKLVEAPRTENVCEAKIAVEKKKGVEEKLPCSSRVSYEKVDPCEDKLKYQMKTAVKVGPPPDCSCSRRAEKERARVDDHPRHYFLRFEETEVDDSVEQMKQKKSLEVVTVKIPVKKAGKSKIYVGNTQETQNNWDLPVGGCNCCAECAQSCKKPTPDYEPSSYRRNAERPESPTRMRAASRPPECDSYEDFIYGGVKASEQEGRFGGRYRSEQGAWHPEPLLDNLEALCCQDCNCSNRRSPPSREFQGEYDSHKRKSSSVRENERFFENKRKGEKSNGRSRYGGAELDWSSGYRDAPGQGSTSRSDPHNPEYYNYNKREFMTKSELLKEEEQKRKVHQPSLQECLESNRPDFYNSAERRRQIISQRAKDRVKKHNARMECLMKLMQQCNQRGQPSNSTGPQRIFTTAQMKEQTMKRYRKLPEVTGKIADERKREEYRTNRLMADIFAKKLQNEALKGHINLSNSVSVLHTI